MYVKGVGNGMNAYGLLCRSTAVLTGRIFDIPHVPTCYMVMGRKCAHIGAETNDWGHAIADENKTFPV